MKVLYLADPYSIHDIKWISYLLEGDLTRPCILSREIHRNKDKQSSVLEDLQVGFIPDFSILRFWMTLFTVFKIKKIIGQKKVDLIHILYAEPNALWCIFRGYFSVPMVITTRGTDVLKTIPETFLKKSLINYLVAPLYKRAFLKADWITCTSERQKGSVMNFTGRNENISLVRTGVDLRNIRICDESELPIDNDRYILFPRFIMPVYNHEFCIKAINLLPDHLKSAYKMIFIGRNSGDLSYQKFLEKRMSEVPDARFIFLERQSQKDLFKLYRRASLVVMTPKSDGSPVSAMEAMVNKVPVILPPLDYDYEIFGDTTFTFRKWEPTELAGLMTTILMDGNSVRNCVDRAYTTVIEKASFTKEMEKVFQIYCSLNEKL